MFCVLIFKTLGAGDPIMLMIFMIFGGVKNHGGMWLALSWLCRVGVSGCEPGFTAIDVSSGSLGRIHGEGRRE